MSARRVDPDQLAETDRTTGDEDTPSEQQQEKARDAREDSDHVDSPTDLTGRSKKFVLKKTLAEFSEDQCTDLAAALTYYAVLALFPAAIALTSVLGLVGQGTAAVDEVLKILGQIGYLDGEPTENLLYATLAHAATAPG